ncbi:MAG: permease-like cell division protein FtsX [bacterium]|nr:permease-like cell division protein FtsX [bacterium]MDD5354878.1 permease-like cell division protein FtsX [bacterium]MDD5756022.1 permease-like cell division protein FtsX [bacterium]
MFNKWITGLVFIIIGLFLLGAANLNSLIGRLEKKLSVVVFLKTDFPAQQVASLLEQVKVLANVESVDYISPDQALADFSLDAAIAQQVQVVGENPLPGSFTIKVNNSQLARVRPLVARIKEMPGIDEIKFGEQEAAKVQGIIANLFQARNIVGGIIFLCCFLLLFYVYSFDLATATSLARGKILNESLWLYLASNAGAYVFLLGLFKLTIAKIGRFAFFSLEQSLYFALWCLILQAVSLAAATRHPKVTN